MLLKFLCCSVLEKLSTLLQWVEVGDVDVDIGANASAEEAEEAVDSSARKVVDIIDGFRLNVSPVCLQWRVTICQMFPGIQWLIAGRLTCVISNNQWQRGAGATIL